jgi:6-pyruvoyltetrahydropterin/6-carboxytetrahydropterin synthase
MIVTAKLDFSSAHRLHNPERDAQWNRRMYDKCDNPSGHGHNYEIEVSVQGPIDAETGMVIDLKKLKEIVRREVIDLVDHKNLNSDVDFLLGVIPTAEKSGDRVLAKAGAGDRRGEALSNRAARDTEELGCVFGR